LSEFISSFSNDVVFLAFADHFARQEGLTTSAEQVFQKYSHATLLDSILHDKAQTLQLHLTLYCYRTMSPRSRYFHLKLQDLRFASDFYGRLYERRFSGRAENNHRPPLVRHTTVSGALHALDQVLESIRSGANATHKTKFSNILKQYARGEIISESPATENSRLLAWYLLRHGVPASTLLLVLKDLANEAHTQCTSLPPPDGTSDVKALDQGIKEVVHATGTRMTTALGVGWTGESLDDIVSLWRS
jgi:anaphase-promoting complex subunit 1